jgi:zinc transporter 7
MVSQNAVVAALSSTALISLAPNVLLLLFPNFASGEGEHSSILGLGQAMAAGGLLGDVFLHTIPHASSGEGDSDAVGLWILLGFTAFLVADMLLRSLNGGGGHSHSHSTAKKTSEKDSKLDDDHHPHDQVKTSAIWLNLAADAMHNFTDGLAIGASFSSSGNDNSSVLSLLQSRGGLATLSILCHEIPHELGDFAVLVKNGYSKRRAILAQFGTAVAAMAGTVVGILLEGVWGEALIYITAGGFIYLAACTILPELLEEQVTLKFRLAQLVFFGAGIAFLYAVSWLEHMDGGGCGHGGHSNGHHQHQSSPAKEDHHDHHGHHDHEVHAGHDHHAHDHHVHDHHAHDHHAHATHQHHDHHDHGDHHNEL